MTDESPLSVTRLIAWQSVLVGIVAGFGFFAGFYPPQGTEFFDMMTIMRPLLAIMASAPCFPLSMYLFTLVLERARDHRHCAFSALLSLILIPAFFLGKELGTRAVLYCQEHHPVYRVYEGGDD